MRTSHRLFAAALSSLLAVAFLTIVPFATPAKAVAQFHTVNIGSATVAEGGVLDFTVTLSAPPIIGDTVTATLKTVDDTAYSSGGALDDFLPDYVHKEDTLTWTSGGGTVKHFTVQTNGDSSKEPDEKLRLNFSGISSATPGTQGTGTITNDDGGPTPTITVSILPADAELRRRRGRQHPQLDHRDLDEPARTKTWRSTTPPSTARPRAIRRRAPRTSRRCRPPRSFGMQGEIWPASPSR